MKITSKTQHCIQEREPLVEIEIILRTKKSFAGKWIKWLWIWLPVRVFVPVQSVCARHRAYVLLILCVYRMQRPVSFTNGFNGLSVVSSSIFLSNERKWNLPVTVTGTATTIVCRCNNSWNQMNSILLVLSLYLCVCVFASLCSVHWVCHVGFNDRRTHQRDRFLINKMNLCYCAVFVCDCRRCLQQSTQPPQPTKLHW